MPVGTIGDLLFDNKISYSDLLNLLMKVTNKMQLYRLIYYS